MGQNYKISFDAELNINQMKTALSTIQGELNKLKFPQTVTRGPTETFEKLSQEIKKFEELSNKGVKSPADFSKLEASGEKIISLYEKLKKSVGDIKNLSGKDLEKLFPQSAVDTITKAREAISQYNKDIKKAESGVKSLSDQIKAQQKIINDAKTAQAQLSTSQQELDAATQAVQQKTGINNTDEALKQLTDAYKQAEAAAEAYSQRDKVNPSVAKGLKTKADNLNALIQRYHDAVSAVEQYKQKVSESDSTINSATQTIEKLNKQLEQEKATASVGKENALKTLMESMRSLDGIDMSKYEQSLKGAKQALTDFIETNGAAAKGKVEGFLQTLAKSGINVDDLRAKLKALGDETAATDARMREIGALKSRIQYFFGLANSITLVRRVIRSAFNTIKELDKVMTETAVVTNFSVGDMWSQLPEYTKRANELGVTTLDAYKAATLYYQQGLKTNEVNALSVETLKMARIAGLDAAEATDRMTNALRGFNMEITQTNAQRVDDVYSELAANTASNVDEISTAMTKVASLANSANMEFETTAAFLAQIIETTRESAETAGTALKTVVARFSEVKKLIDEGSIKGETDEGDIIDVNKVQAALRTAGIDMRQFFLGEIGLDDIFMELASKWDSLTTMQQRYIATQAAGSRQQSRFIALMSDYARTQELVGKAYSSTGASERQFEKTQESLESKLNRLKNAWNEFTMGLANNVIVKGAVDFLTLLLNTVNKLSGAFGDGASFILKWFTAIMAFKGIGSLFSANGALGKFLIPALKGGFLGKLFGAKVAADVASSGMGLGKIFANAFAKFTTKHGNLGVQGALTPLLGLKGGEIAGGVVGLAQAFLQLSIVIAGVAATAQLLYTYWLKFSDKGNIKLTENYAESMHKVADSLQQQATRAKDAKQKIADYTDAINQAETTQKRNEAIVAQNEYIMSLLKEDATYAQYIQQVTSRDGQIYLTLDSKALANAVDTIAKGALEASALTDVADALVANARETYYNNQLANVDLTKGTLTSKGIDFTTKRWWQLLGLGPSDYSEANPDFSPITGASEDQIIQLSDEMRSFYASLQSEAIAASIEKKAYLMSAGTKFTNLYAPNSNLNNAQASTVAGAFAETFKLDEVAEQLIDRYSTFLEGQTRESLIAQYKDIFGAAPDSGATTKDLSRSIAQQRVSKQYAENQTQNLASLVKTEPGKILLDALAGTFEGTTDNLQKSLTSAFHQLNDNQRKQLQQIMGSDSEFAALREISAKAKELAKAIDTDFIGTLSKSSSYTEKQLKTISSKLTVSQKKQITKIAENFADYGEQISNTVLASAFNNVENPDQGMTDFLNQLTEIGDNPVLLLQAIKEAANDATGPVQELAETLTQSVVNNPAFTKTNQLQFFLTSDEFEGLNQQIEEFVEKNGLITSQNIKELAENSATLKALLDSDTVSASGLANVLNGINGGKFGIFDLTDSLINLQNQFYDVESAADAAYATINNFEFGHDYTEGYAFIQQLIDKLKELQQTGSYTAMEKYLSVFFDQLPEGVENIDNAIKILEKFQGNNGGDFWADLFGLKYNKKNGQKTLDFTSIIDDFIGSDSTNFKEYLKQKVKEKYGEDFNLSDEFIDLLMQNLYSKDKTTVKDIASAQIKKIIEDYIAGLDAGGTADKETIRKKFAQVAKNLGIDDPQKWFKEYLEQNGKKKEDGSYDYAGVNFTEADLDLSNVNLITTSMEQAINNGLQQGTLNVTPGNVELGPPENWDASALLQALGTDEDGNFSLERAYIKLGEIVPEVGDGTVSAKDWFENYINDGEPIKINATYQIMEQDEETGTWKPKIQPVTVEASGLDELAQNIDAVVKNMPNVSEALNLANAETLLTSVKDLLGDLGGEHSIKLSYGSVASAETSLDNIKSALETINTTSYSAKIKVTADKTSLTVSGQGGQVITFQITTAARGGIVKSAADGTIEPGLALTGEFDPEIIWNPEKGYAYLAGKNGPEINNLQPGDRVFNGKETKAILRRSGISSFASGGKIRSLASDSVPWGTGTTSTGTGTGSGEGKKSKKRDWKNELDWLYNLVQDIAEYMRKADIASLKYQQYLHDNTKNGKQLYDMLKRQLNDLKKAQEGYQKEYEKRGIELTDLNAAAKKDKLNQYVRYNKNDNTVEIDWDKINKLAKSGKDKDKEKYDKIVEYINKFESAKQKRDQAEQAILEIEEQMRELTEQLRNQYIDFENRVLDALVSQRQAQIDELSDLNESINDVNENILSSIQKEIELQRQIRDNTETEKEINDMEARLAFLRRDTTGANQAEILELEKQLQQARQDYSDTLLDQAIDRLADASDDARDQREKQIDLLQKQLDYDKENGELWDEVHRLIDGAYDDEGAFNTRSELAVLLQGAEGWKGMSEAQRMSWANELIAIAKEAWGYLQYVISGEGADQIDEFERMWKNPNIQTELNAPLERIKERAKYEEERGIGLRSNDLKSAMMDAFIHLPAQKLNLESAATKSNVNYNDNATFNIEIKVDSIADDYDVDRLVSRIKEDLYNQASYRTVNQLQFIR